MHYGSVGGGEIKPESIKEKLVIAKWRKFIGFTPKMASKFLPKSTMKFENWFQPRHLAVQVLKKL